jgi:hypothetical protein
MFNIAAFRNCANRPSATPVSEAKHLPVDLQWAFVHALCSDGSAHACMGRTNMMYAIEAYDPFQRAGDR